MINPKLHILQSDNNMKTALDALNHIDRKNYQTLFIVNENNKLIGTLTDGDIRRGLLNGLSTEDNVLKFIYTNFISLQASNFDIKQIEALNVNKILLVPILSDDEKLIKIIDVSKEISRLPIEAFIMAGGKGTRLKPLTETTPKPLLVVGDKPIIEHNIDRLVKYGIDTIHISIKYLGNQLVEYFGDGDTKNINIKYVEENEPLGTIGSMSLVHNFEKDTVLLMNSDLLTNIDLADMFNEFSKKKTDLMVATIPYNVSIPYAVMETSGTQVTSFKEKPTYTYQSNAGVYLFKKEIIDLIPKDTFFNATDLMDKLLSLDKNITYYPILSYWLDIGKPEDYKKAQEDIKHIIL
jgi:dTDP-glucose pyrophosphorylase